MILSTHAIVGATIASTMPNHPILGFSLAFISHFILDAIPHWDYSLSSLEHKDENKMHDDMILDKRFLKDMSKISLDMLLGILIVSMIFFVTNTSISPWVFLLGIIGGVLPDALQFLYWKWKHEPLKSLQKFHIWIHADLHLRDKFVFGVISQIILIIIVLLTTHLYILR
jgi:phosphatidylglycerophosphatase A